MEVAEEVVAPAVVVEEVVALATTAWPQTMV